MWVEVYLLQTEIEAVNRMFIDINQPYLRGISDEPNAWQA